MCNECLKFVLLRRKLDLATHQDCETVICLSQAPFANSIYLEMQILVEISCVL